MSQLPKKLQKKLNDRSTNNSLRGLTLSDGLIDFSSNDYLGFSTSEAIFNRASDILKERNIEHNGATGSRLLTGNYSLYDEVENYIAQFHRSEASLIFNSGYDANLGFFSSVPHRGDLVFYDEYIHASIRDGISMSKAKGYKFKHNDLSDLEEMLKRHHNDEDIYIVTESVFSMDGDTPDLVSLADYCQTNKYHLIVDEAHAIGTVGEGSGVAQQLGIENRLFARIITFGKAMGCHGAAVLGSKELKTYLVNFARSLVYSTALPPHSLSTILASYEQLSKPVKTIDGLENVNEKLLRNIAMLRFYIKIYSLESHFIESSSAIHSCVISGIDRVKEVSKSLN